LRPVTAAGDHSFTRRRTREPQCESILVGLGREAPRCLTYDKCAPDDRLPRGFCDVGYCCSPNPPFTPPAPTKPVAEDAGASDAADDG